MKKEEENTEEEDIDTQDAEDLESTESSKEELKKVKSTKIYIEQWKNRRWMAWVSLLSIIIVASLLLFYTPLDRIKVTENIIEWFMISMSTIVAAYMGLSTWASLTKRKRSRN